MSFTRNLALGIALLCPLAACTFHGGFEASASTGTPNSAAPVSDPEIAKIACSNAECEERKQRAQAACDDIDRDLQQRQAQAERDAQQQERAAEEQAQRERAQAEAEAAQRQQEADARAQAQLEANRQRRDAARHTMGQTLGRSTVHVDAPPAPGSSPAQASQPAAAAPHAGAAPSAADDAAVVAESEQTKLDATKQLEAKHNEIAQATEERKAKIRKALGRTKADMLIAAQRKRNEVHVSLKDSAAQ
jgi:hypothetical protein